MMYDLVVQPVRSLRVQRRKWRRDARVLVGFVPSLLPSVVRR